LLCLSVFSEDDVASIETINSATAESGSLIALVRGSLRLCVEEGRGWGTFTSRLVETAGGGMPGLRCFVCRVARGIPQRTRWFLWHLFGSVG
jgi:hypothetical protein